MKTTKYLYGLSALLLSAALGSCAYESEKAESPTFEKGTFTLNVTTGSVGAATTRTVTSISSDAALTDTKAEAEKTVSSLVWGIYHAADDADQGKKVLSNQWTSPTSGQTAFTVNNQSFGAEELKFEGGDHVLVAANLSETQLTAYAALATKTDFQQNKLGISEALTGGTGALDPSKLPMFGTSTVTADTETEFSSNVTVNHLVAKVTLNSLSVNFTGTGHASATFKPLEVFLINVPDELTMEYDGTNYTPTGLTLTNLYQGENHDWTAHASADKRVYAEYLGTGTVYDETLDGTDTYSKRYSLYTMPYNFTESSVTNASDNTRLVIKGEYRPSGGTDAVEPMYYAVNLNNGTGDYKIKPNTHYKVTATIKGPGADNAYDAIPLYQNFTANVDYEEWTEEATTATIGNGGIHWAQTAVDYTGIQVGDLIYADGYWNTAYDASFAAEHGEPIAIVFSTTTTAYDQDAAQNGIGNFTHGYAMALKRADNGAPLAGGWCADVASLRTTPVTDIQYDNSTDATQWTNITTDMEGLKHCNTAISYDGGANAASLLAIQSAKGYTPAAPANTSGWYLPSIGQQYKWLVEFAKTWSSYNTVMGDYTKWAWRPEYHDFYINKDTYPNASADIATAINTYLENKGLTSGTGGTFEAFAQGHFLWSSTERTGSYPFDLGFSTSGILYLNGLHGTNGKSSADIQVRAVLAF